VAGTITFGGVVFDDITRYRETPFKIAAQHTMMDGTYRQNVYGNKTRFAIGWDIMLPYHKELLKALFIANTTHTLIDMDGNSHTVAFEGPELSIERRVEDAPTDQRYRVNITLREV